MADRHPTPGEWRAERGTEDDRDRWQVVSHHDGLDWIVAEIHNGAPGDTLVTEGINARLMAAAPTMLHAGNGMGEQINNLLAQNTDGPPSAEAWPVWAALLDAARLCWRNTVDPLHGGQEVAGKDGG